MNDLRIGDVIVRGHLYQKGSAPTIEIVFSNGQRTVNDVSESRTLKTVLDITERSAVALNEFAEQHPRLVNYGFEALQLATGGPAAYLRDKVLTAAGIHEAADHLAEKVKGKLETYLMTAHQFTADHARLSSEVGQFGLMFAASTIGAASKDKVVKSAQNVAEKVKSSTLAYGVTRHGVNRKIERSVKSSDILDALKNPIKTNDVKVDSFGLPSQRFIGNKAEVVINPNTNKIISVNPLSKNKLKRLTKQGQND